MAALYEYQLIRVSPEPPEDGDRGGSTYNAEEDRERLNKQARRVWDYMLDGRWHTLREISRATGDPEASVSARIRDFRKPRFGSHTVLRRSVPEYEGEPAVQVTC